MARSKKSKRKKNSEKKYYAVSVGRRIGIFDTWNEASKSVTSFPKATHKSYDTLAAAQRAMDLAGIQNTQLFEGEGHVREDFEDQTEVKEISSAVAVPNSNSNITINKQDDRKETSDGGCYDDEKDPKERTLTCSDCRNKVFWRDTKLPGYQIAIFARTQRKFTCEYCTEIMLDDKIMEEVERVVPFESVLATESKTSTNSDGIKGPLDQLTNEAKDLHKGLQHLESAMVYLSERFEETRSQNEVMLGDMNQTLLTAFNESSKKRKKNWEENQSTEQQDSPHSPGREQKMKGGSGKLKITTESRKIEQEVDVIIEKMTLEDSKAEKTPQRKNSSRQKTKTSPASGKIRENTSKASRGKASNSAQACRSSSQPASSLSTLSLSSVEEDSESDENSSEEEKEEEKDGNKKEQGLPSVYILHDSILNGVDPERMGRRFGLHVTKKKTSNIDDCLAEIKSIKQKPEAILIHVGVNDAKVDNSTPSKKMKACVKTAEEKFPQTKIIVSQVVPTASRDMNVRTNLINAKMEAAFQSKMNISFIRNANVAAHLQRDGIHPNRRGDGILATNIGYHLENLLWSKQPDHKRRESFPNQRNQPWRQTDYREQQQQQRQSVLYNEQYNDHDDISEDQKRSFGSHRNKSLHPREYNQTYYREQQQHRQHIPYNKQYNRYADFREDQKRSFDGHWNRWKFSREDDQTDYRDQHRTYVSYNRQYNRHADFREGQKRSFGGHQNRSRYSREDNHYLTPQNGAEPRNYFNREYDRYTYYRGDTPYQNSRLETEQDISYNGQFNKHEYQREDNRYQKQQLEEKQTAPYVVQANRYIDFRQKKTY